MDDLNDAERFLLVTFDCMREHPRELVSPSEVGLRMGLDYDRVHALVEELRAGRLLRRFGSNRILGDTRLLITLDGYQTVSRLEKRRGDSGLPGQDLHTRAPVLL